MTEETQQPTETASTTTPADQNVTNSAETSKIKEGKKEKCRPMTKVVVRRLPPSMTQEQFLEQVSPLPEYDYMYFAKADMSLGQYSFCRAYIDFINQQDIFQFREKFDNYVFVDGKGIEFPAVVEFAPFQRVPKKRIGKKKDLKCGTIESDPYYISFLESLKNQETESGNAQPKTEYSYQPSDYAPKKVTSTPLLDFLKQRKQEKQRLRDEKREEKRRRDLERKRSKDEPMISKVLKNMEEKDRDRDRDLNRENKENKDEKDRIPQKDLKNRKKEDRYRDKLGRDRDAKPIKNFRDRDDRIKDREIKQSKKHEDKKFYNKKDDREGHVKEYYEKDDISYKERKLEEKRGKSYEKMRQEKKRLVETQKKQNTELPLDEPDEDLEDIDDNDEIDEKSKNKLKHESESIVEQKNENSRSIKTDTDQLTEEKDLQQSLDNNLQEACDRLAQSLKDDEAEKIISQKSPSQTRITKRRSSLESGGESGSGLKTSGSSGTSSSGSADSRDLDGACLRRHKSLDGGNDSNLQKGENDDKEKDKKDQRSERRIRNKDRPAMEIYRPGMGKFSKQRMEREKGNNERTTPSQSPTPTSGNSNSYKSAKSGSSEVRSMTFKRSVSRDVS